MTKMPDYLKASKSNNTTKKYELYFKKFKDFMISQGKQYLPAKDFLVSLFVVHLIDTNVSHNVINSYIYSIKWMHKLYGYADPTDNMHVKDLLSTSNRRPGKPCLKKDVIETSYIISLFSKYTACTDPYIVRDLTMIIVCFTGFLRYDELSNICNEVIFCDDHVKIRISKSKTDQFRDGKEVLLSKLNSVSCPFDLLQRYVKLFEIQLDSNNFLFRSMYRTKYKCGLRNKAKQLSYTRAREVIISRLREVVPSCLNLGLHSLRASGVTAAANAGVNQRCLKRHGRWRSNAVEGYIKDSLKDRLEVTKKLGL